MHINFVPGVPKPLDNFLEKFLHHFPKRLRITLMAYISCLMLEYKRCSLQAMSAKTGLTTYQRFQYFLSESHTWDSELLNTQRIEELQRTRSTKTCKKGSFVIDDTSCKKSKTCKKTEGAKPQYASSEDRVINCNVAVVSAYCDDKKRYPINLRPYKPADEFLLGEDDPDFKSKIQFAKELIDDALDKRIEFNDILFDNWYFCREVVKHIENKECTWISEADSDRLISFHGKWHHADELVKLIPPSKFTKKVTWYDSRGRLRVLYIYGFTGKVKGIGRYRIVIAKPSQEEANIKNIHVIVTNHQSLKDTEIAARHLSRWRIEEMIRDLKENTAFDQYQVRSLLAITRHWHLSFLAYTFLLRYRLTGSYSKILKEIPETIGGCLRAHRHIQSEYSYIWISKNHDAYIQYLGLK